MLDATTAYGLNFLVPSGDTCIGRSLREHGEFARIELDLLLAYATAPGSFVDVGANLGAICLPFAAARPDWHVIAIEAQRMMSAVLAANALNNRLLNVDMVHAAAGDRAGLAEFPAVGLDSRGNLGTIRFGMEAVTEPVRMLTLDATIPADTRLIKVDVEGFEPQVLEGARAVIQRRQAIWVVEATSGRPELHAQVIEIFLAAGYDAYFDGTTSLKPSSAHGPLISA